MPVNVVLKNAAGMPVTYSGVSTVVLDTDTGETAEFTLGGGSSLFGSDINVDKYGISVVEMFMTGVEQKSMTAENAEAFWLAVNTRASENSDIILSFLLGSEKYYAKIQGATGTPESGLHWMNTILYAVNGGQWIGAYLGFDRTGDVYVKNAMYQIYEGEVEPGV